MSCKLRFVPSSRRASKSHCTPMRKTTTRKKETPSTVSACAMGDQQCPCLAPNTLQLGLMERVPCGRKTLRIFVRSHLAAVISSDGRTLRSCNYIWEAIYGQLLCHMGRKSKLTFRINIAVVKHLTYLLNLAVHQHAALDREGNQLFTLESCPVLLITGIEKGDLQSLNIRCCVVCLVSRLRRTRVC